VDLATIGRRTGGSRSNHHRDNSDNDENAADDDAGQPGASLRLVSRVRCPALSFFFGEVQLLVDHTRLPRHQNASTGGDPCPAIPDMKVLLGWNRRIRANTNPAPNTRT
jgi:hypothetical protein